MSRRIAKTFAALRQAKRRALVIYLTAGDPDVETTVAAAQAAVQSGADILELGIPFSDPVADGPVIARAMLRALKNGGGYAQSLKVIEQVRAVVDVPIIAFGYANPLLWDGLAASCTALSAAGADGLLVVDVPSEEAGPWRAAAAAANLDWVPLLAPTTGAQRIAMIAAQGTGFLYMVSMVGVTGGALQDVARLQPLIAAARASASGCVTGSRRRAQGRAPMASWSAQR
jgi:tryptophan synthase alpha chain